MAFCHPARPVGLGHESHSCVARYLLRKLRKFILLVVPTAVEFPFPADGAQSIAVRN